MAEVQEIMVHLALLKTMSPEQESAFERWYNTGEAAGYYDGNDHDEY